MATIPEDTYSPANQNRDAAKAVLILTANNTEDLEFFYPYYRFIEAGYRTDVVTPKGGEFKAKHGLGLKQTMKITEADAGRYQLLFIPGGKAPAELKENREVVELTKRFVQSGKPVAAICHGPQVLAAADVIQGRRIAAWPEVEGEVKEAGAQYVNEETVMDGQFTTARWPADLPAFMKRVLQVLQQAGQTARAAA